MDTATLYSKIVDRMDKSDEQNREDHEKIEALVDVIQNGNGIMGHKQLVAEWTEHKESRSLKFERVMAVGLIVFNVGFSAFVAYMFKAAVGA